MRLLVVAGVLIALVYPQESSLRILVLEGEDAVNIVQQKTAVRALVEVRDRNNLPVAGATVTFTIGGSGSAAAFAGGAQTLTVTTNAAGQAAAGGINALGNGAFQIHVAAAYQGQVATAAISQSNVATAAAASQAGAAGGGGGGGTSAMTIGIIGGAVAGGAIAATQVPGLIGGDDATTYSADFGGPMTASFSNSGGTCIQQRNITGALKLIYENGKDRASYNVMAPSVSTNANATCPNGGLNPSFNGEAAISSRTSPSFTVTNANLGGSSLLVAATIEFTGTQSGDTISGTVVYTEIFSGFASGVATVRFPVTLR